MSINESQLLRDLCNLAVGAYLGKMTLRARDAEIGGLIDKALQSAYAEGRSDESEQRLTFDEENEFREWMKACSMSAEGSSMATARNAWFARSMLAAQKGRGEAMSPDTDIELPEPFDRIMVLEGNMLEAEDREVPVFTADQLRTAVLAEREKAHAAWRPFALTLEHALNRGDDPSMLLDENSPLRDELRQLIAASNGRFDSAAEKDATSPRESGGEGRE